MHVSASSSEKFETLNFCDLFVKSCLVLGKMLKSCWRSECFWRLILKPPKIAKVELWFERELNFRNFPWHVFFTFFCSEISIILRHRNRIWGGSAYLLHKKAFHALALSFVIFDFCETRIAYGGVVRPDTLRTAPHRRIVMVVGLKKKTWEKQTSRP